MTSTDPVLFRIQAGNINLLQKALNESNKKATKLSVPCATMKVVGYEDVAILHKGKETGKFRKVVVVEVTGGVPKLAGWELIGLLHHITTDEQGKDMTVMHTMPNKVIPVIYRNQVNVCEHCNVSRRRNTTFVLRNVDERHIQVGSSCLADFLGFNADPMALARFAEQFAMLEAKMKEADDKATTPMGRHQGDFYDTRLYLAYVAATIRTHGWLSKGKARMMSYPQPKPTAELAWTKMYRELDISERADAVTPEQIAFNALLNKIQMTEADQAQADAVVSQMMVHFDQQEEDNGTTGDYLSNLRLALFQSTINSRLSGIVASVFAAANRVQADADRIVAAREEMEAALANPASKPSYVGEIGKRMKFQARVVAIKGLENSTLVKMETAEGNKLVWFCSGGTNLVEGEIYDLVGTPKAHEEYKGVKGTIVNRVVLDGTSPSNIAKNTAPAA